MKPIVSGGAPARVPFLCRACSFPESCLEVHALFAHTHLCKIGGSGERAGAAVGIPPPSIHYSTFPSIRSDKMLVSERDG